MILKAREAMLASQMTILECQILLSYKLSYGEYPFGTQWHLLGPLVDIVWAWQGKKFASRE